VSHSGSKISDGACMADWCANSPTTVSTLNVCETTSLAGMPLIDAHGDLACDVAATEAG